jgi:hypothetical protein
MPQASPASGDCASAGQYSVRRGGIRLTYRALRRAAKRKDPVSALVPHFVGADEHMSWSVAAVSSPSVGQVGSAGSPGGV